jgi:hypothetical protein
MVEVRCKTCGGRIPALLGEERLTCPACGSANPLSDRARDALRAVAAERARTDRAQVRLEQARRRLSRWRITRPLRELPLILGFVVAAAVLLPAGYIASATQAYLNLPLRLLLLVAYFGLIFVAMLCPFARAIDRRKSAALEIVRALSPLEPTGAPRCRCCGAALERRERGIARCDYCETESLVDDHVFHQREARLRRERAQQEQEVSRRLLQAREAGIGAYAMIFTFGAVVIVPAAVAAYAYFPHVVPPVAAPALPAPLRGRPAPGDDVLLDRLGDGDLRVYQVHATRGDRALVVDRHGADWARVSAAQLRPLVLRRGHRVLIEQEDGASTPAVLVEVGRSPLVDLGRSYALWEDSELRERTVYWHQLIVPTSPRRGRPAGVFAALSALGLVAQRLPAPRPACGGVAELRVSVLDAAGPAARGGLAAGDLLLRAEQRPQMLLYRLRTSLSGPRPRPIPLEVCRGARRRRVVVYPDTPPGKLPLEPPPLTQTTPGAAVLVDRFDDGHLVRGSVDRLEGKRALILLRGGEDWFWTEVARLHAPVLVRGQLVERVQRGQWRPAVVARVDRSADPEGLPCVVLPERSLFPGACDPAPRYRVALVARKQDWPHRTHLRCRLFRRLGLGLSAAVGPLPGESCGPGKRPLVCVTFSRGPAVAAGIKLGDKLVAHGAQLIDSVERAAAIFAAAPAEVALPLEFCRKQERLELAPTPVDRLKEAAAPQRAPGTGQD